MRNFVSKKFPVTTREVCLAAALTALVSAPVVAQRAGHSEFSLSAHGTEIVAQTETTPANDAVLSQAPRQLQLQFPSRVRLVKLTLHNQSHDWIDINFRYDPRPGQDFTWQLPGLQQAQYYTADWAILGNRDELIRGSFSFSFGPDAEPPSVIQETRRILLQEAMNAQGIRNVSPPPTRIILDQDPPVYDAPFTIQLEDADPD